MSRFLLHLFITLLALLSLTPLLWLLSSSFQPPQTLYSPSWSPPTLSNYRALFHDHPFFSSLTSSLFLSSAQTLLSLTLATAGGFALAKYSFPFRKPLTLLLAATMLLPSQILLPSTYELVYHLGWLDSYLAILIPGSLSVFGLLLFRNSFRSLPDELLHAARLDGSSELRLFLSIALPSIRPMIAAFTLLTFLTSWNSYLWPQIVLQSESKYTLPITLTTLTGLQSDPSHLGPLLAATLLSIIPPSLLFLTLQKDFLPPIR